MTIYVAKIIDGIVASVTVHPAGYQPGPGQVIIGPDNVVGIGWAYQDGQFVAPLADDGGPEA